MRLAFDVRPLQYPGLNRGIGRYTLEMAQVLAARDGLELYLLAEPQEPLPECLRGLPRLAASTRRPPIRQLGCLWDEFQGARWSRFPVDLIHVTSAFDLNFGWPLKCRIPQILTIYDLFSVQHGLPGWRRLGAPLYRWLAYKTAFAQHLVCISQTTEASLRAWLGRRCPATSSAPLGVSQLEVEPWLERPPGEYLMLFPCWPAHKNVEAVVAALSPMGQQAPPLVLAGGLPEAARQRIQLRAGELRLRWTGPVTESELIDLYLGSRGLVFPSLHEGFGLTILEAQRCGVPVAVSNRGPMNEVVPQADQTFDPLDPEAIRQACLKLWNESRLLSKRRQALEFSRQFSWQATAEKTVQAYQSVLSACRGRV
jgi:glycosyltransferase involved in cell wall biosynthesis